MTDTRNTAIGYGEGEACNRDACKGILDVHPVEGCSCHINPPCGACTEPRGFCPVCGWEESEDPEPEPEKPVREYDTTWFKPRTLKDLDSTKIDYIRKEHTHFTMICEGVYPPGATREEVAKACQGTFGGRFTYFENGKFHYIAYTD